MISITKLLKKADKLFSLIPKSRICFRLFFLNSIVENITQEFALIFETGYQVNNSNTGLPLPSGVV